MNFDELKQVVEALLIATPEPLSESRFLQCIDTEIDVSLENIIEALSQDYQKSGRAFEIIQVAGGYQLVTKEDYQIYIKRMFAKSSRLRLSQAALETLSIIAYRQPVTRNDIDAIRGVNSDSPLRTLLERKLIQIRGRDEGQGRALLYRTTVEFLQYFGLNTIKEMPKLREIEELIDNDELSFV